MTFETLDQSNEKTWPDPKRPTYLCIVNCVRQWALTIAAQDDAGDLWHLIHLLQFWQLRTWIHDNFCYMTITSDSGQHSQFLRMFFCKNWPIWLVNLVVLVGVRLSGHHISPVLVPKMAKNKFCELGNPPILGKNPKKCLFFSVTRRSRSDVVYWLTDWWLALTWLMWPWWVMIPKEDLTGVILVSTDAFQWLDWCYSDEWGLKLSIAKS